MYLYEYFKDKKIYCITDTDLDGVSSHLLTRFYIQPIAFEYYYTLTGDRQMTEFEDKYCDKSDIIIFIDLAPTLDLYNQLIEKNKEIFIFDHHETHWIELGELIPNDHYFYSTEYCASKVFFDEITKGKRIGKCIYQYVELVNIYDTWQQQSYLWNDAKKLQDIMWEYVNWLDVDLTNNNRNDFFVNKQLEKIDKGKYFYFTQFEERLYAKAKQKEERNLKDAKRSLQIRIDNSGNKYAYFECTSKMSIIANILLNENPDLIYIAGHPTFPELYRNTPNGMVSLRSRDGFRVNQIAEIYGGGGHYQAAGVDLGVELFKKFKMGEIHLI